MTHLDIRTLGPLEVRLGGRRLELGTRKQRALMALLIVNRRRPVSADGIVAALWGPDASLDRRKDVWVYVSRLRKVLQTERECLQRVNGGYLLSADDSWLDATRFESLTQEGRRLVGADPEAASLVLGEALSLWFGDAYGEFGIEDFAAAEVARLHERRLAALETRIEADLAWRDSESLTPEIQGLVTAHPLRAGLTSSLMLALYRRGRQAEALRAYGNFAEHLAEAGLEPPEELRALEERILLDDAALKTADRRLYARIPEPLASFIGRHAELATLGGLLADHRLITLTGPGGVGKTALGTEVGRRLAVDFDDVAFVDLTAVEPGGGVAAALAAALRVPTDTGDPLRSVLERLGRRRVLLVIDNCEHVVRRAAGAASMLLQGASGLRILATSRVVLDVPGEHIVRLEPLSTAPGGDAELLLAERIAAAGAAVGAAVDADTLRTLTELTAGLPLAVELAAAQLRMRPALDVVAALEEQLVTLVAPNRVGPEHHRELRASIAWSEHLLAPDSATLLRRIAPFRSGFSVEAAETVAGFAPLTREVVRQELGHLVGASLVTLRPEGAGRYSVLEPVRQYAEGRLADGGESDVVTERHARFYLERIQAMSPLIHSGSDLTALDEASAEGANLLAALRWAVAAGEVEFAQRSTAAAVPFWRQVADMSEMIDEIDASLAMSSEPLKSRAELMHVSAPWFWLVRGQEAWRDHLAGLDALAAELDDPQVSAWAALRRADAAMTANADPDEVITLYGRAVDGLRKVDPSRLVMALHQLGWFLFWQWDRWEELEAVIQEWTELAEASGARRDVSFVLSLQSWLALAQGEFGRLEEAAAQTAEINRGLGNHRGAAMAMFPLAVGSLWRGDVDEAKRRIEVSLVAHRETGAIPWTINNLLTKACIEVALEEHAVAVESVRSAVDVAADSIEDLAPVVAAVVARMAAATDDLAAARLLGAAEVSVVPEVIGRLVIPALESVVGELEPRLRRSLGAEASEEAQAQGAAMAPDDVIEMVTGVLGDGATAS